MIEEIKTAYRFLLVLGIGSVLLLFSLMVPVLSSNADFSIYNSGWSGCSGLGREAYSTGSFLPTIDVSSSSEERVVHTSFADLRSQLDPLDSAIMIIGPETDFQRDELIFLDLFTRNGGMLFIADDIGTGNQILQHLETNTSISGDIMADLSYMKQPEFAVTTNFSGTHLTNGVERLLFNYPSTIKPSKRATSVVYSSRTSWLDRNRNDMRDPDEQMGPFSMMTVEDYGKGNLIVLSDPSILINQMKNRFDNSILISNLIDHISQGRGTLVIDESHRDTINPVQVSNMFVGDLDFSRKIAILTGVMVFFVIISNPYPARIWTTLQRLLNKLLSEESKNAPPAREETLSLVMQRHPDWNRNLLEKLMNDIEGIQ